MPEPTFDREDYKNPPKFWGDLGEHLTELRSRILIAFFVWLLLSILAFVYSGKILFMLKTLAPRGSEFFQIKPGELFFASLKISIYAATILSMPLWLKQLELFLKPGLKEREYKLLQPILLYSPLLFWLGLIVAYFFVLPPMISFWDFHQGLIVNHISLEYFIDLIISVASLSALSFQVPIILFILVYFKLVKVKDLIKIWRYVLVGAFLIAAIITPGPDPISMTIVAGISLALYWLAIAILSMSESKN